MSAEAEPGAAPRSLLANSTVLLAARAYGVVTAGVVSVVTVRTLSVDEYARFAIAMAIVLAVGALAELGISALATRQITLDEPRTEHILGVALTAEAATTVVGAAVLVPLGLLLGYPSAVIVLLALGALVVVGQGALAALGGAFQARRVFHLFALCTAVQATVMVVGGAGALAAGAGAPGLVLATGAAYAAAVACALALLRRHLAVRPRFEGAAGQIAGFLRASAPIAVTASIAVVYGRVDLVLLSKLDDEEAVALYNLALTIVELTFLVPAAVATAFYPLLTRQLVDDREDARQSIDLLLRLFLLGSVPLTLVVAFGGSDLVRFVFGDRYAGAGDVLAVLAVTVVANFVNYLAWYALLAGRREAGRIPAVTAGLVLNVALNLLLVPADGARGAALALVITDAFMVGWLLVLVHRQVIALQPVSVLGRALPAAAAAGGVALLPLPGGGLVTGLATAAAFAGVLLATRYVRPHEWAPLLAPLRARQSRTKR